MDAKPQQKTIELANGRKLTLCELSMREMVEYEEKGHSLDDLRTGKISAVSYLVWMMCRKAGLTKEQIRASEWAVSLDDFLDEVTMQDFMRHQETISLFWQDPLVSEAGQETG